MHLIKKIILFLLLPLSLHILISCEKKTEPTVNLPSVVTYPIYNYTPTTANTGGWIVNKGGGKIVEKGICWGTSKYPTTSDNKITDNSYNDYFMITVSGLIPGTSYYWFRAFATNEAGTAYGDQLGFATPELNPVVFNQNIVYDSIADIDNNYYKTVTIGSQVWMAENLKTNRLNDGTPVEVISQPGAWTASSGPACCYYDYDPNHYRNIYGALYNWAAVNTGKLCPAGWHVPADSEWVVLTTFLNDDNNANKLKETGNAHWLWANNGATNETGFTGLPAGMKSAYYESFYELGSTGIWWSATKSDWEGEAYTRRITGYLNYLNQSQSEKMSGISVRCLKD